MIDALGLAETTPGPLILVTEFVGFLAGFKAGGLWMGLGAALLTLWVTFLPSFLWIFAFASQIETLAKRKRLASALEMVTAAAVGVIASLAVWFTMNVLFSNVSRVQIGLLDTSIPTVESFSLLSLLLILIAAMLLLRYVKNLPMSLTLMGFIGIAGNAI